MLNVDVRGTLNPSAMIFAPDQTTNTSGAKLHTGQSTSIGSINPCLVLPVGTIDDDFAHTGLPDDSILPFSRTDVHVIDIDQRAVDIERNNLNWHSHTRKCDDD